MALVYSDFSYHGVVDNGPNGFTQGRLQEATKLGPSWYFSRKELKENFSSRRDVNDWNKESNLRKSYCKFLQDLGKNLNCKIETLIYSIFVVSISVACVRACVSIFSVEMVSMALSASCAFMQWVAELDPGMAPTFRGCGMAQQRSGRGRTCRRSCRACNRVNKREENQKMQ